MNRSLSARYLILALGLAFIAAGIPLHAQQQEPYQPYVGQPGKDVVWVPTDEGLVGKMLDMAQVTAQDYLIDLGSGDGRTVIAAAKRGLRALGIEYNADMVALSIRNAATAGVSDKATFIKADLFESDFSKATVITMFLLPDINLKLRPKLLNLKPGTRIVSNSFNMEEWQPDQTAHMEGSCQTWCTAFLWIIPAKVEGKWRLPEGELDIAQRFQRISGSLISGEKNTTVNGSLNGNKVSFKAGDAEYAGQVDGDTISGTIQANGTSTKWTATREK
jgi:precorrin-6B methylase 2